MIIARTKDGALVRGYLYAGRSLTRGRLNVKTLEGAVLPVELEHLKAVFFVRDFEGDKGYMENKALRTEPDRAGLRVRIRFDDNETIEGVVENSVELLQAPGFFLWPADPESNNSLIYVVKSALLGFKVMGVKN